MKTEVSASSGQRMWGSRIALIAWMTIPAAVASPQAITEYPTPASPSRPIAITLGPDGAMWFSEQSASKIGRITTDRKSTR